MHPPLYIEIMIFQKIDFKKDLKEITDIWNKEYGLILPISYALMERNTNNAYQEASFIVKENEEIAGFIISKIYDYSYHNENYEQTGWISLIYVVPKYRKRGIGTKLLKLVEEEFIRLNKTILFIGKDFYNFFPGLPIDLKKNLEWFQKRGYERLYNTCDLIKNKDIKIPLRNDKIKFVLGNQISKSKIIEFIESNWPGRWTLEAIDYFESGGEGKEYLVGIDGDKVIAFAKLGFPDTPTKLISYSLTWRDKFDFLGGIGPLGVDKSYRGQSIGFDLVAAATNILIDAGADNIIIDWTNLLDFYRKFGFEVYKTYDYLQKNLKGDLK